jgi:hypothetical protein
VYLVAPEPPEPPRVSRRSFLRAAGAGLVVGVAAGYGLGALSADGAPEPTAPHSEAVAWGLRVQAGPLATFLDHRQSFLIVFGEERDPRLVPGVERLVMAVLEDDPAVSGHRQSLATALASEIAASPVATSLHTYLPRLRRIR